MSAVQKNDINVLKYKVTPNYWNLMAVTICPFSSSSVTINENKILIYNKSLTFLINFEENKLSRGRLQSWIAAIYLY